MSTIKKLPQAQTILNSIQTADAATAEKLQEAVKAAAGVDGDRVLDLFEAEAIQATIAEVTQGSDGPLTLSQAEAVQSALALRIGQM